MAEQQVLFPVDDWIRATKPDGTVYEVRYEFLGVGWVGGTIMERVEGVVKFTGLPKDLSKATLVIVPTEYLFIQAGDEAIVRVGPQEVGRDRQTQPTPLQVDITSLVKGKGGDLLVELVPTPAQERNWLRKYGSVRHADQAKRPRILLEGAPVVSPPPGEQPPVTVQPPPGAPQGLEALTALLPLMVLGMMAGAMSQVSEEMGQWLPT